MLRSITLENFRGFDRLSIDGFRRVNVITGANNVGKTALLEGIHVLLSANPMNLLPLSTARGYRVPQEEQLAWTFRDRQVTRGLVIEGTSDEAPLRLELGRSRNDVTVAAQPNGFETSATTLACRYQRGDEELPPMEIIVTATDTRASVRWPPLEVTYLPMHFQWDLAHSFSGAVQQGRDGVVVEAMRLLAPTLQRLVLLALGPVTELHADLGRAPFQPLHLLGQGAVRVCEVLTLAAIMRDGALLIDEVETGLHHSVLERIFKALLHAAEQWNVQLFMTTHSYECLQALVAAAEGRMGELAVFRLERRGEGIDAISIEDEILSGVVERELEIR